MQGSENSNIPHRSLQLLRFGMQSNLLGKAQVLAAPGSPNAFFGPIEMLERLPNGRKPERDISSVVLHMVRPTRALLLAQTWDSEFSPLSPALLVHAQSNTLLPR